jgi:hypothetical protein
MITRRSKKLLEQGFPILPFPCILACEADHFLSIFAVFAGFACKNSKNISFVSAVGAKSAENGKALQHRGATNNGLQDVKCLGRYMTPGILHQTGKPMNFSANSN